MARGNCVVVSAEPGGRFEEGIMATGQTPKPGVVMQKDPTAALQGGRHVYTPYNRDADGDRPMGAVWILREDYLQGKGLDDAYAAGDRCFLYSPLAGEELNMRVLDVAGTGDDVAAGALLSVDDGTGKLVATTGETEMFRALEGVTDPVADTVLWCEYTGY
jgi:hypothetical protein